MIIQFNGVHSSLVLGDPYTPLKYLLRFLFKKTSFSSFSSLPKATYKILFRLDNSTSKSSLPGVISAHKFIYKY